jgi:hypothetical protein
MRKWYSGRYGGKQTILNVTGVTELQAVEIVIVNAKVRGIRYP